MLYMVLLIFLKKNMGEICCGHLIVYTYCSRPFKRYRIIDYKRNFYGLPGTIYRTEYDPYRSAFISLVEYSNGIYAYVLNMNNSFRKTYLMSFDMLEPELFKLGDQYPLSLYEDGMILSNIEMYANKGSSLLRSAGVFGLVLRKYMYFHRILIRLRSKHKKLFYLGTNAIYGTVSNEH